MEVTAVREQQYWRELVAKQKNQVFRWSDAEWSVLGHLTITDRVELCQRATFAKRTLLQQARVEGL